MTVLFLDQYGDLGGAQRCLLDLMPAVVQRGWRPHVAAPAAGPLAGRLRSLGVIVHSLECGRYSMGHKDWRDVIRYSVRLPGLVRAIGALAEQSRAGLFYVNGPRLLPPAAWCARNKRPVLFHCHNRLAGGSLALANWSLGAAGASVVSSSRFALEPLAARRARIVYNGVAEPRRPGNGRHPEFRVGVVGRLDRGKGQHIFLEAARRLTKRADQCRFVICGSTLFSDPFESAYQRELQRLAQGLPVEFTGYVEDAASVIGGLDVLVVPSIVAEATPRVILESYAAGVPVVAFASGGIPEVVLDGETGFLVPTPTAEALATVLDQLMEQPARLRKAAQAGRAYWETSFTLERYQTEVLEAMEAAVHTSPEDSGTAAPRSARLPPP